MPKNYATTPSVRGLRKAKKEYTPLQSTDCGPVGPETLAAAGVAPWSREFAPDHKKANPLMRKEVRS